MIFAKYIISFTYLYIFHQANSSLYNIWKRKSLSSTVQSLFIRQQFNIKVRGTFYANVKSAWVINIFMSKCGTVKFEWGGTSCVILFAEVWIGKLRLWRTSHVEFYEAKPLMKLASTAFFIQEYRILITCAIKHHCALQWIKSGLSLEESKQTFSNARIALGGTLKSTWCVAAYAELESCSWYNH